MSKYRLAQHGQWLALRVTHRFWCQGGEWLPDHITDLKFCSECSMYSRWPW